MPGLDPERIVRSGFLELVVDIPSMWQYIATCELIATTQDRTRMGKKQSRQELGRRERQIMDVIFQLGEASVAEVRARLADPPSYSAVRTMIRLLESKGLLRHRRVNTKYVYRPTQSRESASRSALQHLLATFFGGSATDAVAAILDVSSEQVTDDDLKRMEQLIDQARREGQ
jgi:predicted transcriptional regulator